MYAKVVNASRGPTPGFLIWRLSMKWRVALDRALAPLGLTHAQFSQLGSLMDLESRGLRPSQRELADHTGLEPLYVSKLARTLEAAGLIVRDEHPGDTRAVQLSLTEHGRQVATQAAQVVRRLADQLLAPLGGIDGPGTAAFVETLTALLEAPAVPASAGEASVGEASVGEAPVAAVSSPQAAPSTKAPRKGEK